MEEELPSNMPEPRGNLIIISMFCNTAFSGNIVTRIPQTGILIFINMAPMIWYSKRNNTVKASTFGSEFVSLCVDCGKLLMRYDTSYGWWASL